MAAEASAHGEPSAAGEASAHGEATARAVRQLARLRFDLHDGPQQDLVLLAEDLRLLHRQLLSVLDGNPARDRVVGHIDDLQARLTALDGDLRRISAQLESPFLPDRSFGEALAEVFRAFSARCELKLETALDGDPEVLTDSQQITLLALIREALSNIREHSGARSAWVTVRVDDRGVEASVRDDGDGFEPERELIRAARDGHLGLVGMHERVQMLGGDTSITSQAGGPTIISARLPAVNRRQLPDP
jgi:signal transduction histidine kinase